MAFYEKQIYRKAKDGSWKCVKCDVEKLPCSEKFWRKSNSFEINSRVGEHTYLTFAGVNKNVSKAVTYFGNKEKVVRELITTSNVLPKSYIKKTPNWCFL